MSPPSQVHFLSARVAIFGLCLTFWLLQLIVLSNLGGRHCGSQEHRSVIARYPSLYLDTRVNHSDGTHYTSTRDRTTAICMTYEITTVTVLAISRHVIKLQRRCSLVFDMLKYACTHLCVTPPTVSPIVKLLHTTLLFQSPREYLNP
jgi:hypothetical protein